MKISHLNRITTGTLLLVATIMTLVLIWSLNQLDSSFSKAQSYHQLQSEINSGINRPILTYLATGDATLLTAIDQQLTNLIATIPNDQPQMADILSELPRLEIYSEAEDDGLQNLLGNASASQEDNKDEVGNLSLQELASLIRRYSKELGNIQLLYDQKDVATENATQRLKRLNQHLAEKQMLIEQQYSNTKTRVYVSLIICVALISATGIIMSLLNTGLCRLISQTCQHINQFANGQLEKITTTPSRIEELKVLNQATRKLVEYFSSLIARIDQESTTLSQVGSNLHNSFTTLENIVSEQQTSTENAAIQIEQLSGSYQEVAQNAVNTSVATKRASQLPRQAFFK